MGLTPAFALGRVHSPLILNSVVPIVSTFHLETSLKVIPLTKPIMNTLSKGLHTSKTFVLTQHTNDVYVLLLSLWLSYAGISLERRSTIGKSLSAPIITMFFSLVLSNVFVLPFESRVYSNVVNGVLVPLAIPLLLFDGDLRKIAR